MPILNFRRRPQNELERGGRSRVRDDQTDPETSCPNCHRSWPVSAVWENYNTCPGCGYHYRTGARQRISFTVDEGSFEEMFSDIVSSDPLKFPGYTKKLSVVRAASNEKEAVICGTAAIGGQKCCLFVMEPQFMMGSMGAAVGERIVRLFEYAIEQELPVVGFTVSGGARMQEGLFSLMQMAKTSGAVLRHSEKGLLYLPVLTGPTTGGVTASFGMEGDIILAEPGATIGFAGARVVEQTTRKPLPKGFQTAESMLEHGFVDAIVPRNRQRKVIAQLLRFHGEGSHASQPDAPCGGSRER
ncbi:MAG TPA: acetyl-CoA carboxylase carboxyl transferase subunit beta [Candidatus Merdisoma merdipullorum]|nr:acetyl-CoA carboxylase carboxyl transferase subunit beta [Candidatus Merdisoma merdipullorum]